MQQQLQQKTGPKWQGHLKGLSSFHLSRWTRNNTRRVLQFYHVVILQEVYARATLQVKKTFAKNSLPSGEILLPNKPTEKSVYGINLYISADAIDRSISEPNQGRVIVLCVRYSSGPTFWHKFVLRQVSRTDHYVLKSIVLEYTTISYSRSVKCVSNGTLRSSPSYNSKTN